MNTTPEQRAKLRRSWTATVDVEAERPPTERMPFVHANAHILLALLDDLDADTELLRELRPKVDWMEDVEALARIDARLKAADAPEGEGQRDHVLRLEELAKAVWREWDAMPPAVREAMGNLGLQGAADAPDPGKD